MARRTAKDVEKTNTHCHLNPVPVGVDDILGGVGLGERRKERLPQNFVDQVDIFPLGIEHIPHHLRLLVEGNG